MPAKAFWLVLGTALALFGSVATSLWDHRLDAEASKLEVIGAAYNTYLDEVGDVESLARSGETVEAADLAPSQQALDSILVYGSGDAVLQARTAFNQLRTAALKNDLTDPSWKSYQDAKDRYIDELRDDLGVGAVTFDSD